MIVLNMCLNNKKMAKFVIISSLMIVMCILFVSIYKIFFFKEKTEACSISEDKINVLNTQNYTNVLKEVHENIDKNIGKKIKFTGFVYRLSDFKDNQFVLGRHMIVSSNYQAVVVGFLCELNNCTQYKDGTWVELEGTIEKGDYHGEIPVIKVTAIKETSVPSDEYVLPPDESYVPTSANI